MKFNQLPNFRTEDYPDQQDWISRLFVSLNPFIQSVSQLFDKNVSFGDNILSLTRDYSISAFISFSFLWPVVNQPPQDVRVMKATKGAMQTPCILLCSWTFNPSTSSVTIESMVDVSSSGAAALSGTYNFTMRATV